MHPNLGLFGQHPGGPPASPHYHLQTKGLTEEQRRQYLITGERHRKHATRRFQKTDLFGASDPANSADHWATSSKVSYRPPPRVQY
mmetsp:Transcript_26994/g.59318  ORF Transcript_26994/g.59318 Transcript_26994/m.59318 type:complete len:86 (-) Transcript_26994:420-677(-)